MNNIHLEPLGGGLEIYVSESYRFSTDTILLANFSQPKGRKKCVDLGTGCGTIPLIWLRENKQLEIAAVDIQENACKLAQDSISRNDLIQMTVYNADLKELKGVLPFGYYDLVACNPPYKLGGSGIRNPESAKLIARHETECTLDDICESASRLLQFGGRFCICQRPERLADVMEAMRKFSIEPKVLRLVQQRRSKAPKLFLIASQRKCCKSTETTNQIIWSKYMSGILYVTGTPIGNLGDLSPRAAKTLGEVDFIAAEDTRVTLKLLNHLGIKKPMVSYFEHNKRERGEIICQRIEQGENCAIVTDAGMPCISDPGEDLIKLCEERGIKTVVVPGPSAVISALAISGLETGRFCFEGFLSVNKKSRSEHLQSLQNERRTMIFYEAPHKLPSTLRDLYSSFGDRKLSIVRELTKIHEEVIRTTTAEAAEKYSDGSIKGEIVLVLEGKREEEAAESCTLHDAVELAKRLIADGQKTTEAAKNAAAMTGFKKNDIYRELI